MKTIISVLKMYWTIIIALVFLSSGLALAAKPTYRFLKRQYLSVRSSSDWNQWKRAKGESREGDPIAWLSAPKASLNTIVLLGATEENLHKWPSLSRVGFKPWEKGLKIIQAHRDLHFGNLGKLKVGSYISLETVQGKTNYKVTDVEILDPETVVRRLMESRHEKRLVLLTCYPFRYIGPAPKRYLVWAKGI